MLLLIEVIEWPEGGPFLLKYSFYSDIQEAVIYNLHLQFMRRVLTAEERYMNLIVFIQLHQLLDSYINQRFE